MENSFYILSQQAKLTINRLQLCTWELRKDDACLEIGMEIDKKALQDKNELFIFFPFLNGHCTVKSLHVELADDLICRFIFNDIVKTNSPINGDKRNGCSLKFSSRESFDVVPADCTVNSADKYIHISFNTVTINTGTSSVYIRLLIETDMKSLAYIKRGITKSSYIYDYKINERRNISDNVLHVLTKKNLQFPVITTFFCLTVVPNDFEINFINDNKLKNIRKLENSAFAQYLPELKSLSEDQYIIVFLKDSNKDSSYSSFSTFTKERIGAAQIFSAVGVNLLCSILFAVYSLQNTWKPSVKWYKQIPWEYWIAILLLTGILFCWGIGILYSFFTKKRRR